MKYYLAGPMTGIENYNFPAFEEAARQLRERNLEILSPHEIDHGETQETRGSLDYKTYIKAGLDLLLSCDAIILLPGWYNSRGCIMETSIANTLEYPIYNYDIDTQILSKL